MRQVGVLACMGIIALEENVDRLTEDHANAQILAEGLRKINGITLDPEVIDSNIIYFKVDRDINVFASQLAARGVLCSTDEIYKRCRFITHLNASKDDIEQAIAAVAQTISQKEQ